MADPASAHPVIPRHGTVETASPNNVLGFKGVGELGPIGAPPAVVNAIVDAIADAGVTHLDMPVTAESVWRALGGGGGTARP